MSPITSAQGVVFATAMAVSGTVILLALRLQRSFPLPLTQFPLHQIPPSPPPPILRSCISSDGKKSERKKKKKKKRVHFAEDVMDSCRDGEGFRRQQQEEEQEGGGIRRHSLKSNSQSKVQKKHHGGTEIRGMPANRIALYNGILRDRVAQRLAYSC